MKRNIDDITKLSDLDGLSRADLEALASEAKADIDFLTLRCAELAAKNAGLSLEIEALTKAIGKKLG